VRKLLIVLILMASGRAMTLAFVGRVGAGGVGDPPSAWLMPLVGDAFIGLSALFVAYLVLVRPTPAAWTVAVVWTSLGAFDAVAAFLVEVSVPWPEFFMLDIFGRGMFLAAIALHLGVLVLLMRPESRAGFGVRLESSTPD
jgi:hypothetical protein